MGIESKEEVYTWFKQLSGAKRIEVLSGLLHNCVPLEWRFFATLVESLARMDYQTLLDDEIRANKVASLESLCERDWLSGVHPIIIPTVTPHVVSNPSSSVSSPPAMIYAQCSSSTNNGLVMSKKDNNKEQTDSPAMTSTASSSPGVVVIDPMLSSSSSTTSSVSSTSSLTSSVVILPPEPILPSIRSNVVISLCLLHSTNRVCATVLFKAFNRHLSLEAIQSRLEPGILGMKTMKPLMSEVVSLNNNNVKTGGNNNTVSGPVQSPSPPAQLFMPDPQFVAEITLLYTLAVHHPAFAYEQKHNLIHHLYNLNHYLEELQSRINQSTHPYFYGNPQGNVSSTTSAPFSPPLLLQSAPLHFNTYHPVMPEVIESGDLYPVKGGKKCCYNCGKSGHRGNECTEETLDDVTKSTDFNLNFTSNPMIIPEEAMNGVYSGGGIHSNVKSSPVVSAPLVPVVLHSPPASIHPMISPDVPHPYPVSGPQVTSSSNQLRRPSADKIRSMSNASDTTKGLKNLLSDSGKKMSTGQNHGEQQSTPSSSSDASSSTGLS